MEATTITSRLPLNREDVVLRRSFSISSLMARSFLYVSVGCRDIGFRLVVVVIAYEVLDEVIGEELFEFAVELSRECFVVAENKCGALGLCDNIGHSERLT
jgi:hypothetical protein